jgi:hypothetical protein
VKSYFLIPIVTISLLMVNQVKGNEQAMSCFNLLNKYQIRHLEHKYKININTQTTEAGNWKPNIVTGSLINTDFAEFSYNQSDSWIDKDRIRIQMNLYNLPTKVDKAIIKFKFLFTDDLENFLLSDDAIKWLTIFEIWNEPGWQSKPFPNRISFNLHKNSNEHFLTPVISGEHKNLTTGEWQVDWQESLAIPIYSNQIYSLYAKLKLRRNSGIELRLSGGKGNQKIEFTKNGKMTNSPENDTDIWGINPIKLYTSPEILDRIQKAKAKLEIKFYNPTICLPFNV